jgi:serine/threonine protein kinase
LKRPWNESLDIWSLACTFYEIAFGELLFPYQGLHDPIDAQKNKDYKYIIRNRSINVLLDWNNMNFNMSQHENKNNSIRDDNDNSELGIVKYPISYKTYILNSEINNPKLSTFKDLLFKMLKVDPNKRLNIGQVLSHSFFQNMKRHSYTTTQRPINDIPHNEYARVTRYIDQFTSHNVIRSLSLIIYRRCNDLNNINEILKTIACVWIASKLVIGVPPKISNIINQLKNHQIEPYQILQCEKNICHNIFFQLHSLPK